MRVGGVSGDDRAGYRHSTSVKQRNPAAIAVQGRVLQDVAIGDAQGACPIFSAGIEVERAAFVVSHREVGERVPAEPNREPAKADREAGHATERIEREHLVDAGAGAGAPLDHGIRHAVADDGHRIGSIQVARQRGVVLPRNRERHHAVDVEDNQILPVIRIRRKDSRPKRRAGGGRRTTRGSGTRAGLGVAQRGDMENVIRLRGRVTRRYFSLSEHDESGRPHDIEPHRQNSDRGAAGFERRCQLKTRLRCGVSGQIGT